MRQITLQDDKLKKILAERGKVLTEARNLTKQIEKLQKEQAKLGYKMDRLKEKTMPLMEAHKIDTTEFEVVSRVFLSEKTKEVTVEVVDQIDEYKKFLREKKNEDNSNNSNNKQ